MDGVIQSTAMSSNPVYCHAEVINLKILYAETMSSGENKHVHCLSQTDHCAPRLTAAAVLLPAAIHSVDR